MLATRLAERAGLPVPRTEVVEVGDWLVEHTDELSIHLAHNTIRCQAGLQFGSRYAVSPLEGQVFDYLPAEMFGLVRNLETFAGMLVIDKWTGNANGRQAASGENCGSENTRLHLLIRDIASTPGSGRFPIIRCGECMRGMKYMRACGGGSRSNRGFRVSRRWSRMWCGVWRERFLRSGTAGSGTNWRSWCGL